MKKYIWFNYFEKLTYTFRITNTERKDDLIEAGKQVHEFENIGRNIVPDLSGRDGCNIRRYVIKAFNKFPFYV